MVSSTSTMPRIEITEGAVQGKKTELKACMFLFKKGFNGDDIFDREGNYLGRTDEGDFLIRILITDATFEEAAKDVYTNTQLLTQFTYYKEKDTVNRKMLENTVNHYAPDAGIKDQIQLGDIDTIKNPNATGAFAFWDGKTCTFNFFVDAINGNINKHADNYNNVIIALAHEKMHRDNDETWKPLLHVDVVIAEGDNPNYPNTTDEFKAGTVMYAASLLNDALEFPKVQLKEVLDKIDQFNNSKLAETGTLYYDVPTKTVKANMDNLPGVIISAPAKKKN